MARSYRYRFGGAASTLVTNVRRMAEANGVGFEGSDSAGEIEGKGVKASYSVAGDIATVTVHRIPFIISWGMVESELDSAARSWGATRVT
jgi:hypothetical protein